MLYKRKNNCFLTDYDVEFNKMIKMGDDVNNYQTVNSLLANKPLHLIAKPRDRFLLFLKYFASLFIPLLFFVFFASMGLFEIEELAFLNKLAPYIESFLNFLSEHFILSILFSLLNLILVISYFVVGYYCVKDFGVDFSIPFKEAYYYSYKSGSHLETTINSNGDLETRTVNDYDSIESDGKTRKYELHGFVKFLLTITYSVWAIPRYIFLKSLFTYYRKELFAPEMIKAYKKMPPSKSPRITTSWPYSIFENKIIKETKRRYRLQQKYSHISREKPTTLPIVVRNVYKDEMFFSFNSDYNINPYQEPKAIKRLIARELSCSQKMVIGFDKSSSMFCAFFQDGQRIYTDNYNDWENEAKQLGLDSWIDQAKEIAQKIKENKVTII